MLGFCNIERTKHFLCFQKKCLQNNSFAIEVFSDKTKHKGSVNIIVSEENWDKKLLPEAANPY